MWEVLDFSNFCTKRNNGHSFYIFVNSINQAKYTIVIRVGSGLIQKNCEAIHDIFFQDLMITKQPPFPLSNLPTCDKIPLLIDFYNVVLIGGLRQKIIIFFKKCHM